MKGGCKLDIGLKKDCQSVKPDEDYALTEQQYKCIEMLISGELDKSAICRKLGISRPTIYRWLRDDRFLAEVRELTDENKRQTLDYINSKSLIAAKKLWALTDSGDTRTKCAVLQDWLNRSIGKPKTKMEIEDKREDAEDYDIKEALERIEDNTTPINVKYGNVG